MKRKYTGCRKQKIQYRSAEKRGFLKTAVQEASRAASPDWRKRMEVYGRVLGETNRSDEVFSVFEHLEKNDS